MQSIKIKVWNKSRKGFFGTANVEIRDGVLTCNDDEVILLNTGLKDRNGKEIYEGDIMSVLDRDWPSGDYTNQTPKEYMKKISSVCEVVYEPTEFYLKQIKGRGYFYPQMTGITHRDIFEVIGNIYENPELLK